MVHYAVKHIYKLVKSHRYSNKRTSFVSPMSVIAYMAKRGWEYKDVMIDKQSSESIKDSPVWHIILTKRMPVNYTPEDVVGDIDYRIE